MQTKPLKNNPDLNFVVKKSVKNYQINVFTLYITSGLHYAGRIKLKLFRNGKFKHSIKLIADAAKLKQDAFLELVNKIPNCETQFHLIELLLEYGFDEILKKIDFLNGEGINGENS